LKKKISEVLDSKPTKIQKNLFDEIKFEIIVGPLSDSYSRFMYTKEYEEMKKVYIKLSIFQTINNLDSIN
jgi:NADH:ubiquinone oxidoreductase subunit D